MYYDSWYSMHTMKTSPTLSTLALAILGLISQRSRSGYDLLKVFSDTPMGHFSSSPGAIYPALKRIEESGLIKGDIETERPLRPRQVYTLTKQGKEALKRRLSQPVTHDDVVWRVDDLLLRFVFMGNILGRERTLRFLNEFVERIEAYLSSLREQRNAQQENGSLYGRLALEHGIESYQADARWARRVIKELQADES